MTYSNLQTDLNSELKNYILLMTLKIDYLLWKILKISLYEPCRKSRCALMFIQGTQVDFTTQLFYINLC